MMNLIKIKSLNLKNFYHFYHNKTKSKSIVLIILNNNIKYDVVR